MYKRILVLVDEREATQAAILHAIGLAQTHRADILFFYILPRYVIATFDMNPAVALSPEEFQSQANDHAYNLLMAASKLAEQAGVQSFRAMGSGADDVHCICDIAHHRRCDQIVVGTDGHNAVMRILSGSIVPGLISWASVPVLVCRDTGSSGGSGRRAGASIRARQRREERMRRRYQEKNLHAPNHIFTGTRAGSQQFNEWACPGAQTDAVTVGPQFLSNVFSRSRLCGLMRNDRSLQRINGSWHLFDRNDPLLGWLSAKNRQHLIAIGLKHEDVTFGLRFELVNHRGSH
jgi:nucleotide-binding universal stress UspA family protein